MLADLPQFVLPSGRVPDTSSHTAVFRHLCAHPDRSRSQVSEALGLAKSAVGRVVRDLIEGGWLAERDGVLSNMAGRPRTPLMLNDERLALLGAEVGLDEVRAVAVSLAGGVLDRVSLPHGLDRQPGACMKMLVRAFESLSQRLVAHDRRVVGIGVALPGAVDGTTGHLHHAPHLKWRDVAFADRLAAQLRGSRLAGVPLFVRNEADAAAVGESEFNAGDAPEPLLFLSINVGVGVGVVVDGRLLSGHGGSAGEVGHTVLQIDGPACSCGRQGCAEALIVPPELRSGQASESVDELRRRLAVGDPLALHTVHQAGRHLGVLMNNLVSAFDPALIVLGGAMVELGAAFLDPARQTLNGYAAAAGQAARPLRTARFGRDAVALGAAAVVREAITRPPHASLAFFGPLDLPGNNSQSPERVFLTGEIYRDMNEAAPRRARKGPTAEVKNRRDAKTKETT